jgi:hypothetical protein
MRKVFLYSFFCITSFCFSQTYIKVNGLTALALMPHLGIETKIGTKYTFQADVLMSLWKSVNDKPLQIIMITPEIRYHFKESLEGFYTGAHIGVGAFKVQKWNYSDTDEYQEGINYYIGITVGYKQKLSEKVMLDFFLGAGSIQSFYKGYITETGERYDGAQGYNKSGEFLPYRGGIMICYKLN